MEVHFSPDGIHLPELGLWLDPRRPVPAAWLSHAHSDHASGVHSLVLATPTTLQLYADRWPDPAGARTELALHPLETIEFRGAELTAYPAAHILGAAQLLIARNGERLLYTGDIKRKLPLCGWPTIVPPCDRLIIESTFGLPVFRFLDPEPARLRIAAFARECLDAGEIPAFTGYPLGRGQEIAHALTQAGIPISVHGAIARYIPFYEQAGYGFSGWQPYQAQKISDRALVVTQDLRPRLEAAQKNVRFALVSGWAMFDSARAASGAEELIPYSDHAGFEELLGLVAESQARQVDVVHGYAEQFAAILRARGIQATARA